MCIEIVVLLSSVADNYLIVHSVCVKCLHETNVRLKVAIYIGFFMVRFFLVFVKLNFVSKFDVAIENNLVSMSGGKPKPRDRFSLDRLL